MWGNIIAGNIWGGCSEQSTAHSTQIGQLPTASQLHPPDALLSSAMLRTTIVLKHTSYQLRSCYTKRPPNMAKTPIILAVLGVALALLGTQISRNNIRKTRRPRFRWARFESRCP